MVVEILGYTFICAIAVGIMLLFCKLFTAALNALTKNDD